MSAVLHGAWIDSRPEDVLKPSWWAAFRELGFSTAAIMVESFHDGLDLRWTDDQLAHAGVLARSADVELVLTFCLEPRRGYLAEFERRAPALCEMSGAAAIDSDVESQWMPRQVEGFEDLDHATEEAVKILRGFSSRLDIRLEGDTFAMHSENGPGSRLLKLMDRVLPQAYSVRNRKDGTGSPYLVEWEDRFGPKLMPKITLDRTLQIPGVRTGHPKLCIGLAAYDQKWPGHSEVEAMRTAYDAALTYKPTEIRWWSSRWIFSNDYAKAFFKSLHRGV